MEFWISPQNHTILIAFNHISSLNDSVRISPFRPNLFDSLRCNSTWAQSKQSRKISIIYLVIYDIF